MPCLTGKPWSIAGDQGVAVAAVMRSDEHDIPQAEPSNGVWDGLGAHLRIILDGHGGEGIVAVRPSLIRTLRGNGNAAILLSQLLYWSRRLADHRGWFYQTQQRLEEQTGLGSHAQRKAVKLLARLGILKTDLRGVPAKLYYRVELQQLADLLLQDTNTALVVDHGPQLDVDHGRQPDPDHGLALARGDGPSLAAGHGPPHKENRKESREEMVSSSTPIADGPLAPGATPSHAKSPIDSSPAIFSMAIPGQASGSHPTCAPGAEQLKTAVSAPSDLMLTDESHRRAARPRRTAARRQPVTPIPDDFGMTAAMRAWARERVPAINLARETEKFMNHAKANDRRLVDWPAAWRNWMLKAQEFAEEAHPPASRGSVVL
jgi:hypothetical protein